MAAVASIVVVVLWAAGVLLSGKLLDARRVPDLGVVGSVFVLALWPIMVPIALLMLDAERNR